jgi:hypothetical protein
MSVKQRIKIKKPIDNKHEDLPSDSVRFEEHTEEEYRAHLKKFFKGEDEDDFHQPS